MARTVFENVVSPERIDDLFRQNAVKQYENQLLFSTTIDLLSLAITRERESLCDSFLLFCVRIQDIQQLKTT